MFAAVKRKQGRFEGIGAALIVVGLAAISAALAAPRATAPDVLPLPLPDRALLHRLKARSDELAHEAREKGLSYDVRAVGEAIRRCGAASADGKGLPDNAVGEVLMTVRLAKERGSERGLLSLLSLQSELFVQATHDFERTGVPSLDLRELGGDFMTTAKQNAWLEGRAIVLDDDERVALFRIRWTELTGLRKEALFAPTLDEYRAYYALHLRKLAARKGQGMEPAFSVVRALEKRDPGYPAAFARGVLFQRMGRFEEAAEAFRAHLALHPNGPWTLRAKNHVLGALAQAAVED